jgi:aminoglycoside 3-N-acetyltransferase
MRTEQDFNEMEQPTSHVTYDDLLLGLCKLGIAPGDHLIVHTALSGFGYIDGGAKTLVEVLLRVIGEEGTLLAPYFVDYKENNDIFDLSRLPPPLTGALPATLITWPGAKISAQPSHPVVVVGALADVLTQNQMNNTPVGIGSPFDKIAKANGKVLLLGVNQKANTTIHTGEAFANLPFWGMPRPGLPEGRWVKPVGEEKHWVKLVGIPGCSIGFEKITPFLEECFLIRSIRIGSANCRVMNAQLLIQAVVDFLKEDQQGLFCDRPSCSFCGWASEFFEKTG